MDGTVIAFLRNKESEEDVAAYCRCVRPQCTPQRAPAAAETCKTCLLGSLFAQAQPLPSQTREQLAVVKSQRKKWTRQPWKGHPRPLWRARPRLPTHMCA
jgi:hypothetical protein